jgi:hypothetical protein
MGYAAAEVAPVVAGLREMMLASPRIFTEETIVPVLDPGRGRTKQDTSGLGAKSSGCRPQELEFVSSQADMATSIIWLSASMSAPTCGKFKTA